MTSIAVAYNRRGISMAADSAATTLYGQNNSYKIFNANKIFRLSENSVGIGIYQSANLGNMPREVIINAYRKTNKEFKTLKEYVYDFINYIEKSDYIENIKIEQQMQNYIVRLINEIKEFIKGKKDKEKGGVSKKIVDGYLDDFFNKDFPILLDDLQTRQLPICISEQDGNINENQLKIGIETEEIKESFKKMIKDNKADELLRFFDLIFNGFDIHLNYTDVLDYYSGLVFIGYGIDEYLPQSFHIKTKFKYNNKLFLSFVNNEDTSKTNYSGAEGYADAKVIQSSVLGYNDKLKNEILEESNNCVDKICKKVKSIYNIDIKKDDISFIKDDIKKVIELYGNKEVNSFFGAINFLSLEELGEVVETLVNMTSFKKRVSQEVETVGGMIDVVVISKGDGLIRIKKKNYFKVENNNHFRN